MEPIDQREIDFILFDWLQADALLASGNDDLDRPTIAAMLDLSATIARDSFLPCFKSGDSVEPRQNSDGRVLLEPGIRTAVESYQEAGLAAATFRAESGGMDVPFVFGCASIAQFMAANLAASAFPMLSAANARVIEAFGTPAQRERFAVPQIARRALGTMCLSETQAGSSLGDITTRADADGDDALGVRYRLFGTKMWISGADHDATDDIVHLVLAKMPDADGRLPAGSKGISLFVVPSRIGEERNDVVIAGLNHKMGYRGIPNCVVSFGEGGQQPGGREGAIGYRIGQAGAGLAIMFHMMNEARINVGLGAAAAAYRSFALARDYAAVRTQGRPRGVGAASPPVPIVEHPDVKRMLLAQKSYAEGGLALCLYAAKLVDEARRAPEAGETEALLGYLTPIVKSWCSEWGLAACDLGIQIHGGYGYTRDFDVEQLYRDSRLNPIHEGTSGIQAIDLAGRKTQRDGGRGYALLAARIRETLRACAGVEQLAEPAAAVSTALATVDALVARLVEADEQAALLSATPYLWAAGHLVVGWLWLDQARAALAGVPARAEDKLWACSYFAAYELPKIEGWLHAPLRDEDMLARVPAQVFA